MKRVLITGSSRGIGAAIARRLAKTGQYEIILHGKSESGMLKDLAKELDSSYVCFNIADTKASAEALSKFGEEAFWGVVLNAGIAHDNTFAGLEENEWKSVIETNLHSFYNVLCPLIMPMARAKAGRIIVMSSVSGVIGNRGQSNYSASKAGLIGAAKSLAIELASRKICVNVIAPGVIETDMIHEGLPLDEIKKMIPAKRFGSADEVAALAEFLLSEDSAYITKQVIGVNGGLA